LQDTIAKNYMSIRIRLMKPIIIIPARMTSTRLPDKPLADIHGKPMIVRVLEMGLRADIAPVLIACDDVRIKEAIEAVGGYAVLTSDKHHSGSDRIFEALQLFDKAGEYDTVINLQGDLPIVEPSIISAVLEPLKQNEKVDIATAVCPIKDELEGDDPHVVKAVLSLAEGATIGKALYFSRAKVPYGHGVLYHHIGIYAYRREALERFISLPPSPLEKQEKLEQLRALENDMRIDAVVVDSIPLGVDTETDLEKVRKIIAER